MRLSAGAGARRGFTLVEMLVVMVVLAVAAVILAPRFAAGLDAVQLRAAARDLASALRTARTQALRRRDDVAVILDVEERAYRLTTSNRIHELPPEAKVELTTGRRELGSSAQGGITFFPDGSSTGGRVNLDWSGRHYGIDVHWLTGHVRILDD